MKSQQKLVNNLIKMNDPDQNERSFMNDPDEPISRKKNKQTNKQKKVVNNLLSDVFH